MQNIVLPVIACAASTLYYYVYTRLKAAQKAMHLSAPIEILQTGQIQTLIFLGTGSAIPSPGKRNTSGMAFILQSGNVVLIDCGEGTQMQLMRSLSIKPGRITHILITHLHGDHTFGIFGLLCTIGTSGKTDTLTIVGPRGIKEMVLTTLRLQGGFDFNAYPLHFVELSDAIPFADTNGMLIEGGIIVHAIELEHVCTLHTYGYILQEPDKLGALLAPKAYQLGCRGTQMGQLKNGQDVVLDNGKIVKSVNCLGSSVAGRKIAILQDTCNANAALPYCLQADLIVHECTYDASLHDKATQNGHSTSIQAGQFAKMASAKVLVLSHFSTRYPTRPKGESEELISKERKIDVTCEDMRMEAQSVCPDTNVIMAEDFLVIDSVRINKKKKMSKQSRRKAQEDKDASMKLAKQGLYDDKDDDKNNSCDGDIETQPMLFNVVGYDLDDSGYVNYASHDRIGIGNG